MGGAFLHQPSSLERLVEKLFRDFEAHTDLNVLFPHESWLLPLNDIGLCSCVIQDIPKLSVRAFLSFLYSL